MTNIPEPQHAIYAPSSAHRWIECTASATALSRLPPQESGEEAEDGTRAHDEIERCLGPLNGDMVDPATMPIKPVQADHPAAYGISMMIAFVRQLPPGRMWVERRITLSKDIWGRQDVGHWHEETGTLTVLDYKNGFVDVSAEKNPQLRIYASASIYTHNLPVKWIRYAVAQPNSFMPVKRVKQWIEGVDTLSEFVKETVGIPAGELTFKTGEHCRDCILFGMCPPTKDILANLTTMMSGLATEVPANKVAVFLACEKPIEHWFTALHRAAQKAAIAANRAPTGMKIVQTQKHLAWLNEDAARAAVLAAKGVEALKPPTPAQAKEMGIDISKLADRPEGGPALAFASDRRPEWKAKTTESVFGPAVKELNGAASSK